MLRIIIDDAIPYIRGVLEPFCEVVYIDGRNIGSSDVAGADAMMIRTRTKCDADLLAGSPVKAIATATIGYDHIDMDFCREAGIEVFTAAGCNARGVLQWLGAVFAYAAEREGWEPCRKTLGVVGTGNVGSLAAVYGRLWGMQVLCCDPPRERLWLPVPAGERYAPLDEIARRCDIITFHTPLSFTGADATYHMAGKGFFEKVGTGTLIINASRGEVIDTAELLTAMESGKCTAAVDTWEYEPEIDRRLLDHVLLATPHIAGYTAQGKANASAMSVNALARFFGFPLRDWYPYGQVERTAPELISWPELQATIKDHFDIEAESNTLKTHPADFEALRTSYKYRQEYF